MNHVIRYFLLFIFALANYCVQGQVYKDTIYVATDGFDSYANGGSTSTNYGTDTLMPVFWDGTNAQRTFIDMDLSSIPTNAIVTKAELKMYALSVNNAANHPMYVERVLSSWTETGITWANQPSVTSTGRASVTHSATSSTGWHTMTFTTLGQFAVNHPTLNHGWKIGLQSESGATANGVTYASSEHGTTTQRPYVIIEYVLPIQIDGLVKHCTSGNDDGSITVTVSDGSATYASYTWFEYNMGTVDTIKTGTGISTINISDLSDGLYLCTVKDNKGTMGYKYFIVGEYGATTTVDFRNNDNYANSQAFNEDANLLYNVSTSDGTATGGFNGYFYLYTSSTEYYSALLQYRVDFDPLFTILQADLRLYSQGHFKSATPPTTDSGYVSRVTGEWQENVVTWNTRPSTTTTDRIVIDETTTIGSANRNDTIDLIPFVEYWQANPEGNFGIDFRLKHYGQAANAYLRYRSYDYNFAASRPSFLVSFSLPDQIVTNFVDSTGVGSIVVTAPNAELPYTYLIGYDTLPDLTNLWDNIKDSTDIDSAYFFGGKSSVRTYQFNDLPSNRYFVGVYDNNGDQILMREVIVTPSFEIFDSTNLDVDSDTLLVKAGMGSAEATVLARLPILENGGIEFKVVQLDDVVRFGFNNVDDAFPVYGTRDYNYCVEITTTGKTYLSRADTLIDSTTVVVGDRLALIRESGEVILYKNNQVVGTDLVARHNIHKDWKLEVELAGPDAKLKPLVAYGKFKLPKLTFNLDYLECGETETTVHLSVPTSTYFPITFSNFVLKDETGATIYSGSSVPGAMTLGVGIYTLHYQYTLGGISYSVYIGQIPVGFPIIWTWDPTTGNIVHEYLTLNTIYPANSSQVATAEGINQCENLVSTSNWVQFESSGSSPLIYTKPVGVWSWAYEEIVLKFDNGTVYAKVRIEEIGGGIISREVTLYNGTTPDDTYLTNSLNPFSLEFPTDGSANYDYVELYQDGQLKADFQTNSTGIITVHAKEYGSVKIKNTIASFCGENQTKNYADLTKKLDGGYYLSKKGIVKFIYKEEYKDLDNQLKFNVYDSENQLVISNVTIPEVVVFGDNRYTLDFSCSGINNLPDGIYILEVVNEKNEKWYLRFKVVNNC